MANVIKWIQKSKNNGLQPGEEILAALGVAVQNKVKDMAAGALGGLPGELVAAEKLKKQETESRSHTTPLVEEYPTGAVIVALTSTRLLVYRLNFLGRPKSLGVAYERNKVSEAQSEKHGINYSLTITFADGGSVTNDVSLAQGNELQQFIGLINKSKS